MDGPTRAGKLGGLFGLAGAPVPSRRLAAILAADVVGYARLMGEDERGTRAWLKAHLRELIDPAIACHGGLLAQAARRPGFAGRRA